MYPNFTQISATKGQRAVQHWAIDNSEVIADITDSSESLIINYLLITVKY